MSNVTVAATQMACGWDRDANIARAEKLMREAAKRGAQIILLQELFETPYFCKDHNPKHLELAQPLEGHPAVEHFRGVARELAVVLPISVFERANNAFYNSLVMVDADGQVLGSYRKSHIPEGPGYHEKFYFSPGDTGFKVFDTALRQARRGDLLGPVVSGDGALHGADGRGGADVSDGHRLRTAGCQHRLQRRTGSAPCRAMPRRMSCRWWPRTASARRQGEKYTMTFYGSSFIASHTGEKVAEADRSSESVLTASFDLDEVRRYRQAWGVFRDRRPDLYYPLLSLDGRG